MRKTFAFCLILLLTGAISAGLHAGSLDNIRVIKNPKPNMEEKNFKRLVKVGEISDALGPDAFLFYPYSITMDKSHNLYIYDVMQAMVLKLDKDFRFVKSWGRVGRGPGEFSGTGIGSAVYLNVAPDGNLYAHDIRGFRVLVFTTEGKFIRHLNLQRSGGFDHPLIDSRGHIIMQAVRDNKLDVFNEKDDILFSLSQPGQKKEYLFREIKLCYGKSLESNMKPKPLSYSFGDLCMRVTGDDNILLYFRNAGKIRIFKDGEQLINKYLWPKRAMDKLESDFKKDDCAHSYLFFDTFTDNDAPDLFYLHHGGSIEKKRNYLYRFNVKGELVTVLYADYSESDKSGWFIFKQNNLFFAKDREQVYIYKEEK